MDEQTHIDIEAHMHVEVLGSASDFPEAPERVQVEMME